MQLSAIPTGYATSRDALHLVAAQIVARARFQATGRFGLRALPGGFGTPAFGDDVEVVRVSGTRLIREVAGAVKRTISMPIDGSTLAELAAFAGVDLAAPFDGGHDLPAVGDPNRVLTVDRAAGEFAGEWFAFACPILDEAVAGAGPGAEPIVAQLWPEHFDVGLDLLAGSGVRVNLGVSLGDGFHATPYLYVGPWDARRPGDGAYWNAPFGAALGCEALVGRPDASAFAADFLAEGLARLA